METFFRRTLVITGFANLFGAVMFAPLFPELRAQAGLPAVGQPFDAWLVAMWTLFFGLAYLRLEFSRRHEPLFIQVAIAGKLSFVALLFVLWREGTVTTNGVIAGLPDAIFATIFLVWLGRSSRAAISGHEGPATTAT